MQRGLLFALLIVVGGIYSTSAYSGKDSFTLYLIRHAEKDPLADDPSNPPLDECGKQRAQSLEQFFSDVELKKLYSTDYIRTKNTVKPIADAQQRAVVIYDPYKLDALSETLLTAKQNTLIVGHSNTTSVLAGLLLGQTLAPFNENIYDRIYQIVVSGSDLRISLLHQTFVCAVE